MNGIAVYKTVGLGPELSSTPVAGANDTVIGANVRRYSYSTLPTASALYIITGIEWLNGTVVNGNCTSGVDIVNAIPPTDDDTLMAAQGTIIAQSGASAVQRTNFIRSFTLPGGTILGAYFGTASATGRYGTTTVSSGNYQRAIAATMTLSAGQSTAWTAVTEEPYSKLYFKAVS